MNSGRHILSRILDLVDRKTLSRLVERYDAESRVRHFGCRQQLVCMVFAQLTWREGLRDIATCLNARPSNLHHLGFSQPIAKSTLAATWISPASFSLRTRVPSLSRAPRANCNSPGIIHFRWIASLVCGAGVVKLQSFCRCPPAGRALIFATGFGRKAARCP